MKTKSLLWLLPILIVGYSQEVAAENIKSIKSTDVIAPFPESQIHEVQTAEEVEANGIGHLASVLLSAKDYNGLEKLAAKYRVSKEAYADGVWKLFKVYEGLEPAKNATEQDWVNRQNQIESWIKAKPDSVTAQVAMGWFLVAYAWHARGGGWANTVTEDGWKLFGERLKMAAKVLAEARQLPEKCPVYWSALQRVALGMKLDKVRYDAFFDKAIKEFPDYTYLYRSRAVYLLPRWYGKEGEWQSDLTTSADRIGGEEGDILYARVVWLTHQYGSGIDVFEGKKISWERVDRGMELILKRFPDSLAAKNERAFLAGKAGDREAARKYMAQTKGEVDSNIWSQELFLKCYKWLYRQ